MAGQEANELDVAKFSGCSNIAMKAVENLRVALWELADVYGIPKHVLFSKRVELSTEQRTVGTNTFTVNQEELFKRNILDGGSGNLSISYIRKAAYTFAQANKIPHNFDHKTRMASRAWFRAFIQRNPDISYRVDDDSDDDEVPDLDEIKQSHAVSKFIKQNSRDKHRWSADDTSDLIDIYKSFPILWDPKYSDDKYKKKKAVVWKDIATRFNTTIPKVRHKMKQVFLDFINEKKKFEDADRIENFIFESKLFSFGRLNFLESLNIEYNWERVCEDQSTYNPSTDSSSDHDLSAAFAQELRGNTSHGKKRRYPRSHPRMKKMLKIENIDSESDSSKNEEDAFDIFGQLVAKKIRSFPTEYAQNTVQRLIQNILCDGEMGLHNGEDSHEEQTPPEESD